MLINPKDRKNKRRTEVTQFDAIFETHFNELLEFKRRFGHCDVPQHWSENRALGNWVIKQRVNREFLDPLRYQMLKEAGFKFDYYEYLWNKKYEELKEYHQRTGHCNVTKRPGENNSLAGWVGKQRRDYKELSKNLTLDKIVKLNTLGFNWGNPITPWEKRYSELKKFKKRFGHCNVPRGWKHNKPLAGWVAIQRTKYSQGKLLETRFNFLESIGFVWKMRIRRKALND